MNKILSEVLKQRKGHYCHALEVTDVYDLQAIIESIVGEFFVYGSAEIIDFLQSAELYCLNDDKEEEVFNFDISAYVHELMG